MIASNGFPVEPSAPVAGGVVVMIARKADWTTGTRPVANRRTTRVT
jgi:hypothetical protein